MELFLQSAEEALTIRGSRYFAAQQFGRGRVQRSQNDAISHGFDEPWLLREPDP